MIVYVGNMLSKHGKSKSFIELLSSKLESRYQICKASDHANKIVRLLEMLFIVFKYRKKINVVLIDTYSTGAFWYAFLVGWECRLFSLPYIPVLHGGNLPFRYKSSPCAINSLLKNAAVVVSPSLYLLKFFNENGFAAKYIPNFIEIKEYPFRDRTPLKPKILWVRAFHKIYNPTLAIRMLLQLSEKIQHASLCMVGAFKDSSIHEVREMIQEYRLEQKVEITGIMRKEDWIAKARDFDIFVNTTDIDNMPISLIEAMALGLPVVSTKVGGIPYLIQHNKNGLLVSSNNAEEMTEAVIRLIDDQLFAKNIIRQAREHVEQFDWNVVSESWFKILDRYESVAVNKSSAPYGRISAK